MPSLYKSPAQDFPSLSGCYTGRLISSHPRSTLRPGSCIARFPSIVKTKVHVLPTSLCFLLERWRGHTGSKRSKKSRMGIERISKIRMPRKVTIKQHEMPERLSGCMRADANGRLVVERWRANHLYAIFERDAELARFFSDGETLCRLDGGRSSSLALPADTFLA